MSREPPTCCWCAIKVDGSHRATAGPAVGLPFCAGHAKSYAAALDGDEESKFMLRALARKLHGRHVDGEDGSL